MNEPDYLAESIKTVLNLSLISELLIKENGREPLPTVLGFKRLNQNHSAIPSEG